MAHVRPKHQFLPTTSTWLGFSLQLETILHLSHPLILIQLGFYQLIVSVAQPPQAPSASTRHYICLHLPSVLDMWQVLINTY